MGIRVTGIAAIIAMSACTGGYVVDGSGNQWTPASDGSPLASAVVTFANSSGSYQVWTKPSSTVTEFSFDPYASAMYTGTYQTNDDAIIPSGTYTVSVAADHVWQVGNVAVDNANQCPYSDEYTGQSPIDCQLFQLQLLGCNQSPKAPYQSGNVTVVQLAQTNSGQCGPRSCSKKVVDVAGSYFTNPVISEVYVNCGIDAPGGCKTSPNTGMWAALSNSTPFWSRMVEYAAGVGSYGGSYSPTELLLPQIVTDQDIEAVLPAAIQAGWIKSPYSFLSYQQPAIFIFYLPSTSCAGNCDGSSHHVSFYGSDGQLYNVALIAGYSDAQTQNSVAAHEIAEAVTDVNDYNPGCGTNTGCGWNEKSTNEGEIADLCASNGNDVIDGFDVAKIWSQARCTCL
jgi:hypothetical protein